MIEMERGSDGVWSRRVPFREQADVADEVYRKAMRRYWHRYVAAELVKGSALMAAVVMMSDPATMGDGVISLVVYLAAYQSLSRLSPACPRWTVGSDHAPRE